MARELLQHPFKRWEKAVSWLREQPDQQTLMHGGYNDDLLVVAVERYFRSPAWQAAGRLLQGRAEQAPAADCHLCVRP